MIPSEIERLLPKVQKPARYCGGEINTIIKDKSKVIIAINIIVLLGKASIISAENRTNK